MKIKINSAVDRNNILIGLVNAGYIVYMEIEKLSMQPDNYYLNFDEVVEAKAADE